MAWWNMKLPDDPPEWRAHCEAARKNNEELRSLAERLRVASGIPAKNFPPLTEPSEERVRQLRARWMAEQSRPKRTPEERRAYWATVRSQFEASARFRAEQKF
jgi:hypothetical protein